MHRRLHPSLTDHLERLRESHSQVSTIDMWYTSLLESGANKMTTVFDEHFRRFYIIYVRVNEDC